MCSLKGVLTHNTLLTCVRVCKEVHLARTGIFKRINQKASPWYDFVLWNFHRELS